MKQRIVQALQKHLLNPPGKLLFALGIVPPGYATLETTGRKAGKPRRTPVGDRRVGSHFLIVAEHGMAAGYIRNIASDPRVRVKVREGLRVRWYTSRAQLLPEDDPHERQRWLAHQKPGSTANASVVRLMGTQLLTVRVDLEG
jgi:deazaflavin-dependent oxidoreductase (nitroreductase family)